MNKREALETIIAYAEENIIARTAVGNAFRIAIEALELVADLEDGNTLKYSGKMIAYNKEWLLNKNNLECEIEALKINKHFASTPINVDWAKEEIAKEIENEH